MEHRCIGVSEIRHVKKGENIWAQYGRGTREWREQDNEELIDLYCSSNIIRMLKSRWAMNVAPMRERCLQRFGGET